MMKSKKSILNFVIRTIIAVFVAAIASWIGMFAGKGVGWLMDNYPLLPLIGQYQAFGEKLGSWIGTIAGFLIPYYVRKR